MPTLLLLPKLGECRTVLLGVVTIVSGVATGLFADLRSLGQVIGLIAFGLTALLLVERRHPDPI